MDYICGNCGRYDSDISYCPIKGEVYEEDTCSKWIDEVDLTEDERYDGGVMSNFDNENPKEVEDYIDENI